MIFIKYENNGFPAFINASEISNLYFETANTKGNVFIMAKVNGDLIPLAKIKESIANKIFMEIINYIEQPIFGKYLYISKEGKTEMLTTGNY